MSLSPAMHANTSATMGTSPSELDVPINLAVDFADELEFELGLGNTSTAAPLSSPSSIHMSPQSSSAQMSPRSAQMSPSPSQTSTMGHLTSIPPNSPASTAYMTSPPTSPIPMSFPPDTRPDSDSDSDPPRPSRAKSTPLPSSYKGKSRAIPTPTPIHVLRDLNSGPREFHTPPDTSFGTPSASGSGSTSRAREKARAEEPALDLPSIMPLGPSSSDSSEPEAEIEATPRPSRIRPRSRVVSGLSFSSIKEAMDRRRSISRQPSTSGLNSPTPSLARRLSLNRLGALVRRKKDKDGSKSRSGLSSGVTSGSSTPASAFLTPSSTIVRRGSGNPRASVLGPWESGPSATPMSEEPISEVSPSPRAEFEVVSRPVRGRAETAPAGTGDYFGFTFGFEDEEEVEQPEPSREDSSDVLIQARTAQRPASVFETLPRELHVLVLSHLARSYVEDYERDIREGTWSAGQAGNEENKWVGEAAGLRAIIGTARVSRAWFALAHDGSFWSKIQYASIVPPRPAVPAHTTWLPQTIRAQIKAQPSQAELEAQDERVMRLLRAAGPCLTDLDLRGFTRINARHVERLVGWISAPTVIVPKPEATTIPSLLSLTRYEALPSPPSKTTNLTRLVLSSCVQIPSHALHTLLSASPLLTHLEMRGLPAVTDETCSIISTNCRSITHLDISRCQNLGPEALAHICGVSRPYIPNTGLMRLKTLHMAGYAYVDSISLSRLGKSLGHVLETLNLANAWGISDDSIAAYVQIQPTPTQIERAKVVEVERWARAQRGNLGEVQEERVDFITLTAREAGLEPTLPGPFYRRLTALRHLNLNGCRRLSDTGLGALAHAVPNLEMLELAGIAGVGQPGLVKLLKTTKKIRRLDLEETGVGDAVLEALTPPMDPDLDPPDESDEEESIQIAMRADPSHPGHALTHLILSQCTNPQLTSPALAQLVRACPRLRVLAVDGTQVDDRVVRFFVCASQARSHLGAELTATDTRHVARAGLPAAGTTRPRRGTREWAARGMGYVDARDRDGAEGDECDENKVVVKTYWSWQSVDATLERRRAGLGRRNTDGGVGGSGIRGNGPRWRGRPDERTGCVIM